MKKNKIALILIGIISLNVYSNETINTYYDLKDKNYSYVNTLYEYSFDYIFKNEYNEDYLLDLYSDIYNNHNILIKHKKDLFGNYKSIKVLSNLSQEETEYLIRSNYFSSLERDAKVSKIPSKKESRPFKMEELISSSNVEDEPEYGNQLYMLPNTTTYQGASNIKGAIDYVDNNYSTGKKPVIAVLDTGYIEHEDLIGKIIAGYKFSTIYQPDTDLASDGRGSNFLDYREYEYVTNPAAVEDGADPIYATATCEDGHGTAIKNIISGNTDNTKGIAGIVDAEIIVGKVLDYDCINESKSFGLISDIGEAILWASGESLNGVPDVPKRADIINLSLGGNSIEGCGAFLQSAINTAINNGSIVVVSAGNENKNTIGFTPASCNNIINIASNDIDGLKSLFSNFGELNVDLSILGENLIAADAVTGYTDYKTYTGTSFSTGIASGFIGLMQKSFKNIDYKNAEKFLKENTIAHNSGYANLDEDCTNNRCGTGILDGLSTLETASISIEYSNNMEYYFKDRNTCDDKIIISALSNFVNTCNLFKINVLNTNETLDTNYKIISKLKETDKWVYNSPNGNNNFETLTEKETTVVGEIKSLVLLNYNSDLDYAVLMCDDDLCYPPLDLDFTVALTERPLTCN